MPSRGVAGAWWNAVSSAHPTPALSLAALAQVLQLSSRSRQCPSWQPLMEVPPCKGSGLPLLLLLAALQHSNSPIRPCRSCAA